jgi:hypothetical protein
MNYINCMSQLTGTAVQINMYPMDVRHVEYLLPHHVRVFGSLVDRIVVTIDTHRSRSGRYRGNDFDQSLTKLRSHIEAVRAAYPKLEVFEVDYSPEVRRSVAQYFFNTDHMPVKAWDGGPFYSYFFGLFSARARYIMHFDCDMLFGGGGAESWMREALQILESKPDVLFVGPLPGPPRSDGRIFGHPETNGYSAVQEPLSSPAYRFNHVSSRVFLIDMERLKSRVGALPLLRPDFLQRMKSRLLANPPEAREAEVILSRTLQQQGLYRIDFLGTGPGLWSLHPPYRSETFYKRLPEIVHNVETGTMPSAQRGHFELDDSIVDWSPQRAAARWHRRYWRLLRDRLSRA